MNVGKTYILVITFLLPLIGISQSTLFFDDAIENSLVTGQMLVYEDESGIETFPAIQTLEKSFVLNNEPVLQYASTQKAIWLKTSIKIETDEPVFLKVGYPMMDTVELYAVGDKGNVIFHKIAGSLVPISQRDLEGNYIKFQLQKGLYTYYLRAKSTYTLQLPLSLVGYQTLYKERLVENIIQGAYLGFALLIILYTLFLWVSLRDRVYLFYILHIIATAIITLHIGGYSYLLWWPDTFIINKYEPIIFGLGIFSTAFAIVFLETQTKFKKLNRWFMGVLVVNILVFPISLMGFHTVANNLVQLVGAVGCTIMLVGGVVAYRKGFKSARFFLLAWSVFLVGVVISILQRVGVLPYEYYFVHASQIGSAIDMVLLSFALADRINQLREDNEKSKYELYNSIAENEELMRQKNILLTKAIEERSKEMKEQTVLLRNQKQQLEELNQTKDRILSVVAHDLRGPLGNVSQLADMMKESEGLRNEETLGLLKESSKRSLDLLDSLLHWAKAQFGDAEYQLSEVNLYELTNQTIQLYSLKAKAKEISVYNNVPHALFANADLEMTNTVIRNLISNALKFTLVGGEIEIGGEKNNKEATVSLWVIDSGMGIPEEKLKTIFEAGKNKSLKGTDGETGSGLGLVICKDFIEKNNGTIAVSSDEGKGSKFIITLPAATV